MNEYPRLVFTIPVFLFVMACSTTPNPTVASGGDPALDAQAQAALQGLMTTTPQAAELRTRAKGEDRQVRWVTREIVRQGRAAHWRTPLLA